MVVQNSPTVHQVTAKLGRIAKCLWSRGTGAAGISVSFDLCREFYGQDHIEFRDPPEIW